MATNRVTGVGVEVLNEGATPNIRTTALLAEVLNTGATPNARLSGVAVEVLTSVAVAPPTSFPVRSFGIIIL